MLFAISNNNIKFQIFCHDAIADDGKPTFFDPVANNLNSSKTTGPITTSIVEQAITIKDDHHDVSVSNLVISKDRLHKKGEEVNSYLKELCINKNIFLINHSKSIRQRHLNKS